LTASRHKIQVLIGSSTPYAAVERGTNAALGPSLLLLPISDVLLLLFRSWLCGAAEVV
jgi:hypothetical protein